MALNQIITEARKRDLQDKLRYYLVAAAIAVMNESDTTPNHANRLAYARTILRGQENIQQVAMAFVANTTIAGKIETGEDYDSDIAYVISTIFDAFANAEVA